MMKRFVRISLALIMLLVLAGVGVVIKWPDLVEKYVPPSLRGAPQTTTSPPPAELSEAKRLVASMSPEQKAAQLIMVRRKVAGPLLAAGKVGGVAFFEADGDLKGSTADIAARANALQKTAVTVGAKLPVLVAVDQEYGSTSEKRGGAIRRLTEDQVTLFPGNMALGATNKPELAKAAGQEGGSELKRLGFNTVFGPVADTNTNPLNPVIGVRSFGDDPKAVATLATAMIGGFQSSGIATAVKHFPGHGDTATDSHTGLPIITSDAEAFKSTHLLPFATAVKAGADMVMVGHIKVTSLDPNMPTTLSRPILTDLLRKELGFGGVIITDSMEMDALDGLKLSQSELALRTIEAGADIVLMPTEPGAVYDAILAEVSKPKGRISMDRLDASVTRIVALKLKLGLKAGEAPAATGRDMKSTAAQKVCSDIAAASVTLLAPKQAPATDNAKVVHITGADTRANTLLAKAFPKTGPLEQSQVTILTMTMPERAQLDRLAKLKEAGRPVYVILTGLPYGGAYTTTADATIATYSNTACSVQAAARALLGKQSFEGILPVSLPGSNGSTMYKRGHPK